jgi:hypothetical protein
MSTKETERIIKSIRVKNLHGYLEIIIKMIKVSAPYISSSLNWSLSYSFKIFHCKPLFKKGDRENMANYRPISLLTSLSKVFEKIIYERFLQHINVNNILIEEQFGFRPDTSTD